MTQTKLPPRNPGRFTLLSQGTLGYCQAMFEAGGHHHRADCLLRHLDRSRRIFRISFYKYRCGISFRALFSAPLLPDLQQKK